MSGSTKATVMDTSYRNSDPLTSEFTFMNVTLLNSTTTSDSSQSDIGANVFLKIAGIFLVNFLVLFGNILIFLAVFTDRALRTTTVCFIVNLAVADLLLGVVVLPFAGYQILMESWDFSDPFCDIWAATDVLCSTASIFGLCCIGIDRYIGVTRPLKHHLIMTKKKTLLTIGLSWACAFGVACGPLFGWRPKRDSKQCPMTDSMEYGLFSTSISFYIPLVIVLIMYYRIYREVRKQTKAIKAGEKTYVIANEGAGSVTLRIHVSISANRKTASRKNFVKSRSFSQKVASFNRQKRAAKTLGIVVGGFIICWLPFFILFPLSTICTGCISAKTIDTCTWLGYCNSFLNPFIYAYSNQSFRNAFKRLLMCKCKKTGLYRSRQLALRKISNINRYTTGGGESPILSHLKHRKRCKHPNNDNISLMQLEKVSEKRDSIRRQRKDKPRDVLPHIILEQEVESSLANDRTNSVHEQNYVDQREIMNQGKASQTVDELPKTQTFHLKRNIYTNGECGSTYPNDTLIESADGDSSSCDEDEHSPFIHNLQNRERFFDESTRIYNNFLQTRTPRRSSQKGRRPSAPSAHFSVVVETVDDPKQPRRGSYFV
ncbi:alpha-1A adrenergic receptor-like [Anneissia japonica]|uniref:alpha-1A adrenergic receptor-like n=1 Tax=Anneissia japonica TaxID=1529436 RepID=UPI0014258EBA|nr:alpha-1A adrenergic receptor-like [Anneissia japonica]XP_033125574.1 alpha-1A adrenergic receptor-like [Anneissia japonica]XP_033125575.1 alpha-1A adrenergic receptor-like [Anneissia japonica]XP_033125576.1 alpha-1A adrenergic receptor-like [Anneissia japonica]XP_033125577.1 alpha-1A adrenergic receptor-like [Anneissia japonica]XP_033125578.1 alpha-1A adrenergic receptor-like [Anneissia japonica]